MTSPTDMKDIIEARIFLVWGTTAVYSSLVAPSVDTYGDVTPSWGTASSITVVPANAYNTYEAFFQFGNLEKGDQDILLRPTQSVQVGDKVVLNSNTYRVKTFKLYAADSVDIVIAARLTEII